MESLRRCRIGVILNNPEKQRNTPVCVCNLVVLFDKSEALRIRQG